MGDFLRTEEGKIVTANGRKVMLRGVNLGGWLMMEGYIMHAPNRAEQLFKKGFAAALGKKELENFEKFFRANFIRETDIRQIARLGFNCIRVPFNAKLIEESPYRYSKAGTKYLDQVIAWAKKHKIWVILDLHGACGAQNYDWHSDSLGDALLWKSTLARQRTIALWNYISDRYKNETAVAGYDLLNESVTSDTRTLNAFYKDVIRRIRKNDSNHIIFVEGNNWARDLDCLDEFDDNNLALSIHYYGDLDFTFNFVPQRKYPQNPARAALEKKQIRDLLFHYQKIAQRRRVPILVGEFGVNARQGFYGEDKWLRDVLSIFGEFNFHWTYWTYKAVKNSMYPDGVFSFLGNPPWVNRPGPLTGWENYHLYWQNRRREMVHSWRTENFEENTEVLKVLKNALR